MPDEPTLLRQWKLISLLSARQRGLTIRELAREMNVVGKTIRRDLDLFCQVGLPVEAETASGDRGCKRWRIAGTRGQPPLTFNFQEAAALYLASQFLEPMAGTPLWDSAQSALRRIRATLGENAARYLERAPDPGVLLGLERQAAALYFANFGRMLKAKAPGSGFDFTARNRRPRRDPVNALLSFAYALLAKDCFPAACTVGFDPYQGFYHVGRHGRPSLALDLMDELRPDAGGPGADAGRVCSWGATALCGIYSEMS